MTLDSARSMALITSYLALAVLTLTAVGVAVMWRKPEYRNAQIIKAGAYTGLALSVFALLIAVFQAFATS